MLQMVRLYNLRDIMVTGLKTDQVRLAKAKELGAEYTHYSEDNPVKEVLDLTDNVGANVAIDCSGGEAGTTQATRMVRIGGWITIMSLWGHDIRSNLDKIPLTVWVRWSGRAWRAETLLFVCPQDATLGTFSQDSCYGKGQLVADHN